MSDDNPEPESGCLVLVVVGIVAVALFVGMFAVIGWITQGAAPIP